MMTMNVAEGSIGQLATKIAEARGKKLLMVELGDVEPGLPGAGQVGMGGIEGPMELMVALVLALAAADHIFRDEALVSVDEPGMTMLAEIVADALKLMTGGELKTEIAPRPMGILQ